MVDLSAGTHLAADNLMPKNDTTATKKRSSLSAASGFVVGVCWVMARFLQA
jgi:hypothetical protein